MGIITFFVVLGVFIGLAVTKLKRRKVKKQMRRQRQEEVKFGEGLFRPSSVAETSGFLSRASNAEFATRQSTRSSFALQESRQSTRQSFALQESVPAKKTSRPSR